MSCQEKNLLFQKEIPSYPIEKKKNPTWSTTNEVEFSSSQFIQAFLLVKPQNPSQLLPANPDANVGFAVGPQGPASQLENRLHNISHPFPIQLILKAFFVFLQTREKFYMAFVREVVQVIFLLRLVYFLRDLTYLGSRNIKKVLLSLI